MKEDFERANEPSEAAPVMDAPDRDWETEELNYDPPEKVHDRDRPLAPSPFGDVEVDLPAELDHSAQRAIQQSRQKEPSVEDSFSDLRSIDEVPGAAEEYEAHVLADEEFEQRMMDRFNHAKDRGPQHRR